MMSSSQRLDTLLRDCGIGSKRQIQSWIAEGRISVENEIITVPSFPCPENAQIFVDGHPIPRKNPVIWMMHKPAGYMCVSGQSLHPSVFTLMKETDYSDSLFCIGRLDADTTGLLLITNTGRLNESIARPDRDIKKVYQAGLDRPLPEHAASTMAKGVRLEDGTLCRPAVLTVLSPTDVLVEVTEGRRHEVKRLIRACGARVRTLKRISIGGLSLDPQLEEGEYRKLTDDELCCIFQ